MNTNRCRLMKGCGLLVMGLMGMSSALMAAPRQTKPNIIFILADDMGYGDVGCYNENCKIPTPHLDRLGKEGMRFTDAHTNSSVCTPTRYGILTGRYAWRTRKKNGVLQGHSSPLIERDRGTVASLLKAQGYATACIGKWHLGMDWTSRDGKTVSESNGQNVDFSAPIRNGPLERGFDYFFGISASLNMPPHAFIENRNVVGELTYLDDAEELKEHNISGKTGWVAAGYRQDQVLPTLTRKAVAWIRKHTRDHSEEPFFLFLPLNAPHAPIVPSKDYLDRSGIGRYGDFCMEVDGSVGEILKTLDELNLAGSTMVIFTADNGCSPQAHFGDLQAQGHYPSYIYRGLKGSLWEGGHRMPFLVRWPDVVKEGTQCHQTICVTDFLATLADMLKVAIPDHVGQDSVSFFPALQGKPLPGSSERGIVHHSDAGHFSIRRGKWKLVLHEKGGTRRHNPKDGPVSNPAALQLFDMEKDPSETTNVQHLHREKVEQLSMLLANYIAKGRSTPGVPQENDPGKHWTQIEVLKKFLVNRTAVPSK